MITIVDIIEKAREYRKAKSLTTAVEVCDMLNEFGDMAEGLARVALVADLDDHDMASVLNGHESDMLAMIAGALLIMQDQGGMDAYTAVRLIKKFIKHTHIKLPNDDD